MQSHAIQLFIVPYVSQTSLHKDVCKFREKKVSHFLRNRSGKAANKGRFIKVLLVFQSPPDRQINRGGRNEAEIE